MARTETSLVSLLSARVNKALIILIVLMLAFVAWGAYAMQSAFAGNPGLTASADPIGDDLPDLGDVEADDPVDDPNPSLYVSVVETGDKPEGEPYALGEEFTYKIVVINDGNQDIADIKTDFELQWLAEGTPVQHLAFSISL